MSSKTINWLKVLCFTILITSLSANAKTVDLSAHFASESYWNGHAIYIARITDIKPPTGTNAHESWTTSFEIIKSISGGATGKSGSIRSNPQDDVFSENDQPAGFPEGLDSRTQILISEDTSYKQVTVVRVLKLPDDQELLTVLEHIANVRQTPNLPALLTGATSESDLISEYCLNHLLTLPDQALAAADLSQLQSMADDPKRSGEHRIAAEENVLKFSGTPRADRDTAEYKWLRGTIQTERQTAGPSSESRDYLDYTEPFIAKLFGFEKRQAETTDYILGLMTDKKAPVNLRNAAGSALSRFDQRVFNFQHPDERFDRMFNTYLTLLKDENPDLRIMGMSLLFDRALLLMSYQSPPNLVDDHARTAVQALQKALADEKDARVRRYFSSRLEIQKMRQKHPELNKQMRDEFSR